MQSLSCRTRRWLSTTTRSAWVPFFVRTLVTAPLAMVTLAPLAGSPPFQLFGVDQSPSSESAHHTCSVCFWYFPRDLSGQTRSDWAMVGCSSTVNSTPISLLTWAMNPLSSSAARMAFASSTAEFLIVTSTLQAAWSISKVMSDATRPVFASAAATKSTMVDRRAVGSGTVPAGQSSFIEISSLVRSGSSLLGGAGGESVHPTPRHSTVFSWMMILPVKSVNMSSEETRE
mmetsp:Transcript_72743/g.161671  ORF Transcript_72743/g.161671 Transcript_72743/m.161671 type:complete len:230 (+) Transcript_72743:958-1647(+)